ncbi:MAG TPA: hypothetical protein VGK73_06720 [Polyangiaceae bacterium]
MKTTNWMGSNTKSIPEKVRSWAGKQMVRIVKTNEVFDRWQRTDGETLVVRR